MVALMVPNLYDHSEEHRSQYLICLKAFQSLHRHLLSKTPSVALNHSLCLTCWVSDGAPDPKFPMDSAMAEEQSVSTEGMILLGHISHLILVDPWGFQPMPVDATSGSTRPGCPCWVEALIAFSTLFNPLALIRAAGP
ncbi:unnamed protein product, partial [Coregonus sp. 'balchen']